MNMTLIADIIGIGNEGQCEGNSNEIKKVSNDTSMYEKGY